MGGLIGDIGCFIASCVMTIVDVIQSVLATLVQDLSNPLQLLKDFINVNVELISGEAFTNLIEIFPMTRWLYLGVDHLTGGFLDKLDEFESLPAELLSGQTVTRAMVLNDLSVLIVVLEVVIDVYTMNIPGLIGVTASLLAAGPIGQTALGRTLLTMAAIGADAVCGDGNITQAFIDAGENKLQSLGLTALAVKIGVLGGAVVGLVVAGGGAALSSGDDCSDACEDAYGVQTFDFTPSVNSSGLATQSATSVATKAGVNPLLTAGGEAGAGAGVSALTSCCEAASDEAEPAAATTADTPVNLNDPVSVQAAIDTGATVTDSSGNEVDLTDPVAVASAQDSGTEVSIPAGTPIDLTDPAAVTAANTLNAPVATPDGTTVNLADPVCVQAVQAASAESDTIIASSAAPAPTVCQCAEAQEAAEEDEDAAQQEEDSGMTDAQVTALLQALLTITQVTAYLVKSGKTPKQIAAAVAQATRLTKTAAAAPSKAAVPASSGVSSFLSSLSLTSGTGLYLGIGAAALTTLLLFRKKD